VVATLIVVCWLEVSTHAEAPATGHLNTCVLGFPLSWSKYSDVSEDLSCYRVLLMRPFRLKFIEIKPHCCQCSQTYFSGSYSSALILKIKILRPLSQSSHSDIFTLMLLLSEGRAGEACEHSNKSVLFLPPHSEVSLTSLMTLHFHLLFYYTFNLLSFIYDTRRKNLWWRRERQPLKRRTPTPHWNCWSPENTSLCCYCTNSVSPKRAGGCHRHRHRMRKDYGTHEYVFGLLLQHAFE
jgi:hypothetical protein